MQLASASEFNFWVFVVWQQPKGRVQLSTFHWPLVCFWHQKLLCYSGLDVLAHLPPPLKNTRLKKKKETCQHSKNILKAPQNKKKERTAEMQLSGIVVIDRDCNEYFWNFFLTYIQLNLPDISHEGRYEMTIQSLIVLSKEQERQEETRRDSTTTAASLHETNNQFLLNITLKHKVAANEPRDGRQCGSAWWTTETHGKVSMVLPG